MLEFNNMKRIQTLAGFLFLLGLGGSAGAAKSVSPSSMLTVTTKIKALPCNASISGTVDHGVISRALLHPTQLTQLNSQNITLNIDCEGDTLLRIKVSDEKTGAGMKPSGDLKMKFGTGLYTMDNRSGLGLGKNSAGIPIGAYALQFAYATVVNSANASMPVKLIRASSATGAISETPADTAFFLNLVPYFGAVTYNGSSWDPAAGKTFTFPIVVATTINKSSLLKAGDTAELDGKVTMEIVYL
ncbi:DUF1120 domain-containing protein [Herbaspirillum sp. RTI4]|uniref:DUF1120 domain-containing protein n=1 Tax=Herbaspirillum sp. RTI4 TaxID=3048640 RepID=UPI002AB560A7|nr:DUF1120 domain-containing protein [Herbaspirillum sp. RTI4]MDY7577726.1 DUF1120 domain-containing protein [Herbaspirillum sp. RTI4]MEA9980846.1 DUF1120 domain-containing protein [Herbaspirillum sp. RTI4]